MNSHKKEPEQQSLNITPHLSGNPSASGQASADAPVEWVFIEVGKVSSGVIDRLRHHGPERTSGCMLNNNKNLKV